MLGKYPRVEGRSIGNGIKGKIGTEVSCKGSHVEPESIDRSKASKRARLSVNCFPKRSVLARLKTHLKVSRKNNTVPRTTKYAGQKFLTMGELPS